ncbi:WXG100-like domain-containing protein [Nocardiopsis protaetiae]|uniref:WXG100-like domain-containing protein n=2 Tax=Nocardiopsis protaetiae TaxID=3382270 RepID=UPI00387ABABC
MGMEIPDELANLFYGLTGTKWPKVDEDRLRDFSDLYATVEYILATELPELVVVLRRKVQATFDGRTTEYFENSLAQFTAGERDYIGESARLAGEIRTYAKDAANQVEYAKWMIIGQLIQLVLEIAWAIATAKFTFGATLKFIPIFRFIRNQVIQRILRWLVWNLLSHLFVAQLFGTTMDLLIQRIQMDQGNREEWDKELTRMAAAGAFVEGLLSAGLSFGADVFLSGQLAKLFGKNLPDPPGPPPPVRDIVPEPPPGPPAGPPVRDAGPTPTPRDIPDPDPVPPPRDTPGPGPASGPRNTPGPGPAPAPPPREVPDGGPGNGGGSGRGGPAAPTPLPPGSITPEFNRDLVTVFARNSNEFLSAVQRPNTASRGMGHPERFIDGSGDLFARHFGDALGADAARNLGREYAETLLRTWNTPRMNSALDDVLGGAPLPQSTRDHLARDVPDAFGRTVADFGNRWRDRATALGIGAGSGAFEGYFGEGLTNLAFSPEHEWKASGMSAVAGAASSVVHDLAVTGGLRAIDALGNLRDLNDLPLPEPGGGGSSGAPPRGDGDGSAGTPGGSGGSASGAGGANGSRGGGLAFESGDDAPVLRLRGGGGDDASSFGDYGDFDSDDGRSSTAPSESGNRGRDDEDDGNDADDEWSSLAPSENEGTPRDGASGTGRPGSGEERPADTGSRGGRSTPIAEAPADTVDGGRSAPPSGGQGGQSGHDTTNAGEVGDRGERTVPEADDQGRDAPTHAGGSGREERSAPDSDGLSGGTPADTGGNSRGERTDSTTMQPPPLVTGTGDDQGAQASPENRGGTGDGAEVARTPASGDGAFSREGHGTEGGFQRISPDDVSEDIDIGEFFRSLTGTSEVSGAEDTYTPPPVVAAATPPPSPASSPPLRAETAGGGPVREGARDGTTSATDPTAAEIPSDTDGDGSSQVVEQVSDEVRPLRTESTAQETTADTTVEEASDEIGPLRTGSTTAEAPTDTTAEEGGDTTQIVEEGSEEVHLPRTESTDAETGADTAAEEGSDTPQTVEREVPETESDSDVEEAPADEAERRDGHETDPPGEEGRRTPVETTGDHDTTHTTEVTETPAPREEAPPPPGEEEAADTRRLNYIIESRWVESYGVRVDPDTVLGTLATLPPDVRAALRKDLAKDPRDFFSPHGVRRTAADGRTFTLRLSTDDAWRPGGRDRPGAAASAKYKGLHDEQTQTSRGESGLVGSARRPVVSVQANLLGVDGIPAPAVGLRGSAFAGSAVQQQSGDAGHTQLLTTEMTGAGTTFGSDLTVTWRVDGDPPPAAVPPVGDGAIALADPRDPPPARIPHGVELVLMGGLQTRDDLPAAITFADPLAPPPAPPADGDGDGDGGPTPGHGGFLANSHPVSVDSITRRHDGSAEPGSSGEGGTGPTALNSWIADRLGFEPPGTGSNVRRLLHRPRPGSGEPTVVAHRKTGSRAEHRELDRRGVMEVFADDIVMTQLPTMTGEPRTLRVPDADGGTRLVTLWSYPTSMELVPDTPKNFNIKLTDRFARGASVLANRLKGFFVAVSGGAVMRVPGDAVRVDVPYFEARFQKVWAHGRGRSDNAWDARLFHSTDTAVYRTRRTIAVWVDGDDAPTLFDMSGTEALTADDARRLYGGRPEADPVETTGDPFLDREGGPTHFGDALVRDVTFDDGAEVRTPDGGPPRTFFRDFAHKLLVDIDRQYPGLVLPHLALPGTPAPRRSHAGWNHRRSLKVAKANTETVLAQVNAAAFRADRDRWLSGQMEVKLVESKLLPGGNEVRERRWTVPDHISVWPKATVTGYSEATPLAKSHTGTTTGSSSGLGRRDGTVTSVTAEGRTGAIVRGVSGGVDSFGNPSQAGGGGFRAANEFRSRRQSEYGVSMTGETNVKDKSGSRRLFADVEFSAWIGPDDGLVPRSSRFEAPARTGMARDVFGEGTAAGPAPRAAVELHAPRVGRRVPLDAPPEGGPAAPRRLPASTAARLFGQGPFGFVNDGAPVVRFRSAAAPPLLSSITEVTETPETGTAEAETAETGPPGTDGTAPVRTEPGTTSGTTDGSVRPRTTPGTTARTTDDPADTRTGTEGTRDRAEETRDGDTRGRDARDTDTRERTGSGTTGRDVRRTDAPPPLEIERTDRARRLSGLFSSVQAFNPAVRNRGPRVITVASLTYAGLDRDHWSFSRTVSARDGGAAVVSAHTSPQSLAASPGLQRRLGDRFRIQLDDGPAPWRARPTTATWYVPTHVVSAALREFAVMEPNQVQEISFGTGRARESVFTMAVAARGIFNPQPTAESPGQAPRGSAGPIVQPGLDLRYTPHGHGRSDTSSVSYRARRELKFTGATFEFITHGVLVQATEHKRDFDLLFSVPRSPGDDSYSAWTAPVRDAQKTMVPALWVFAEGLVHDRLTWHADGRIEFGAQPPPQSPPPSLELRRDLPGKGYDTRPVDVPSLVDDLEQRLRRAGWELTTHSREDVIHTVNSHISRGLTHLPRLDVRVRNSTGRSRIAQLDLSVFRAPARVEHLGGLMEFVDRNIKATGDTQTQTRIRGHGGGGAVDLLGPIGNREDPGTGRQTGAVSAGGTPAFRHQSLTEDSSSSGTAREETQERVVFTPYAVVTSPTRVDARLTIGEQVYTASAWDREAESVYPLPYLEVMAPGGEGARSGPRYEPATIGLENAGSYPDTWAASRTGPGGGGYQNGEGGLSEIPVAIENDARELLDAAVVNAALVDGWTSPNGRLDLNTAEVESATRHLEGRISAIERTAGATARTHGMLLRSLTPDASQRPTVLAEYGATAVKVRALFDVRSATIESVGNESRARDSEQEGGRRSQTTSVQQANNLGVGGQATETGRPADRIRENLDADSAGLRGARDGTSDGQRHGAVASGPGTKRMFLVRVPARWLVWAENADSGTQPRGGQVDASVLRWVDEDTARSWGLATDTPRIRRYAAAEAAFTEADAAYFKARGELFEYVGQVDDPGSGGRTYRGRYEEMETAYRALEAARNSAMRELVEAMRELRGPRAVSEGGPREEGEELGTTGTTGTTGTVRATGEEFALTDEDIYDATPPGSPRVAHASGTGTGPIDRDGASDDLGTATPPRTPRVRPAVDTDERSTHREGTTDGLDDIYDATPPGSPRAAPASGTGTGAVDRDGASEGLDDIYDATPLGTPREGADEGDFFVTDREPRGTTASSAYLMTPALPAESPTVRADDASDDLGTATPPRTPRVSPAVNTDERSTHRENPSEEPGDSYDATPPGSPRAAPASGTGTGAVDRDGASDDLGGGGAVAHSGHRPTTLDDFYDTYTGGDDTAPSTRGRERPTTLDDFYDLYAAEDTGGSGEGAPARSVPVEPTADESGNGSTAVGGDSAPAGGRATGGGQEQGPEDAEIPARAPTGVGHDRQAVLNAAFAQVLAPQSTGSGDTGHASPTVVPVAGGDRGGNAASGAPGTPASEAGSFRWEGGDTDAEGGFPLLSPDGGFGNTVSLTAAVPLPPRPVSMGGGSVRGQGRASEPDGEAGGTAPGEAVSTAPAEISERSFVKEKEGTPPVGADTAESSSADEENSPPPVATETSGNPSTAEEGGMPPVESAPEEAGAPKPESTSAPGDGGVRENSRADVQPSAEEAHR